MKRQLIEDFLNLPGIVGIALIDGQSRVCAYGLPEHLQPPQQQRLTQALQAILETTPVSLQSLSFNFSDQQIFLYKVDRSLTLLVLTEASLSSDYDRLIAQITRFMKTDFDTVLAVLMAIASPRREAPGLAATESGALTVATVEDALTAMNQLSTFTVQYLGNFIVANHWRTYCPSVAWTQQFEITAEGLIQLQSTARLAPQDQLTHQQRQWMQTWVSGFSQRCAKIIRNYLQLVQTQALEPRQWQLLFEPDQ
jgi:hypothetical protein